MCGPSSCNRPRRGARGLRRPAQLVAGTDRGEVTFELVRLSDEEITDHLEPLIARNCAGFPAPSRAERRGRMPGGQPHASSPAGWRAFIDDRRVLEAIASTPREQFVPASLLDRAYDNEALPIAGGQTISQPLVVARMLELLELTATSACSTSAPDPGTTPLCWRDWRGR